MIILFANQKGGAGKSTLTLLLANYLTHLRHRALTVIDMDYQQSLSALSGKSPPGTEPPYEIVPAELPQFPDLLKIIRRDDGMTLVDLPGKMDDDGLIPVFGAADLVICPVAYDRFSVDSTLLFSMVVRRINPSARICYVPNRIKTLARYDNREEFDRTLAGFGTVTPALPDRVDFQRVMPGYLPITVVPLILPVFDPIYQAHLKGGGRPR